MEQKKKEQIEILFEEDAGGKKVELPAVMKPVPVKTKRLLYKGII